MAVPQVVFQVTRKALSWCLKVMTYPLIQIADILRNDRQSGIRTGTAGLDILSFSFAALTKVDKKKKKKKKNTDVEDF